MGPWLIDVVQRSELEPWLGEGPQATEGSVVMLVRGDGEAVRELLPNALDAAKLDPRRRVVWVKDESLLTDDEHRELFRGDDSILAVVIDDRARVGSWVYRDRIAVADAIFAFERAGES